MEEIIGFTDEATEHLVDIRVENHGSLFLLHPVSAQGREWIEENVQAESYMWVGAGTYGALACEPRYVADIVNGAREAGLEVR